ncbi:MAG: hypothetical protein IPM57_08325 [Oligoflexia bacterium]|nr:hypothetical protein [Oligoflexia bacterium]
MKLILIALLFSNLSLAKEIVPLKMYSYTIHIERANSGFDEILVKKKNKAVSKIRLERMDASPEVLKFNLIKNAPGYVFIDYYKGSSGTRNMMDCYEALVYKIEASGKIKLTQKLEYKCDVVSADPAAQAEAFKKNYQLIVKNKKPILVD